MPIYEYVCKKCGHEMEAIQKHSDEPLLKCPKCNKKALEKLISTGGFVLKGDGFYKRSFDSQGETT